MEIGSYRIRFFYQILIFNAQFSIINVQIENCKLSIAY